MKRIVIASGLLAASLSAATAGTLDTVKQRGTLVCGVSAGFAGFSAPDSQGNYKGLDVDYCRALAAGVLGDASKVRYVALTAQNRFTALQSGEIDVLYRNSTQTYLRGVTLGLRQGPVNFYDGQGFVVKKDAGVKELKGLNGATVCVAQGTTHEVTLGDYGRANGIEWKPLVFDRIDTMYQTFFGGRCDAMTQDASALAGAVATAAPNAADYVVLPQTISKEPLGPFTRNGDEVWSDIITWLHYGLVEAEELGVTAANADEMAKSSDVPAIQRLLGASGELGSRLGLDNKWMLLAIKAGGNYGEIFERNVGKASPLKLDRGLNASLEQGRLDVRDSVQVKSRRRRGVSTHAAPTQALSDAHRPDPRPETLDRPDRGVVRKALAGSAADEFARRQPVGRSGARRPTDRRHDRAFPDARAIRGRHRFRRDPVHLLGVRPLHRGGRPRARADAGAKAQRGDDRAGRQQGPQDRPALDVSRRRWPRCRAEFPALRRDWCQNWRKARWPRSTAATARSTIGWWWRRQRRCAIAT